MGCGSHSLLCIAFMDGRVIASFSYVATLGRHWFGDGVPSLPRLGSKYSGKSSVCALETKSRSQTCHKGTLQMDQTSYVCSALPVHCFSRSSVSKSADSNPKYAIDHRVLQPSQQRRRDDDTTIRR